MPSAAAFGVNAAVTGDTAFADQTATLNGFRVPDVIANLRVDQDWGFAGISGALHDASGAYYGAANNVANGHPADKLGWAVAVGGKLNLPGGDMVGANACYSEGAAGFCAGIGAGLQIYNASSSVGVGWLTDAIFDTGTEVQLTRVWSAIAAYEHVWNPKWRTSWFGGYVNVGYNDTAKNIINSHLPGAGGTLVCGVPLSGTIPAAHHASPGGRRQQLQSRFQLLRDRLAHAVEPGATARYRSSNSSIRTSTARTRDRGSIQRTRRGPRSPSSMTRTSGPRCSAGSATSIRDRFARSWQPPNPRPAAAGGRHMLSSSARFFMRTAGLSWRFTARSAVSAAFNPLAKSTASP